MDATVDDGSFGRLVNDSAKNANAKVVVIMNETPHLCLFAVKDIDPGTEIRFSYGAGGPSKYPWRRSLANKVCVCFIWSE